MNKRRKPFLNSRKISYRRKHSLYSRQSRRMKPTFKNKLKSLTKDRDSLLRKAKMELDLELAPSEWECLKTPLTLKTHVLTLTYPELMSLLEPECLPARELRLTPDPFLVSPFTCVSKLSLLCLTTALGRSGTWTLVKIL